MIPSEADATFVLAMADATAAELIPGLVDIVEAEAPGDFAARGAAHHARPARAAGGRNVDLAVGFFPAVLARPDARGQSARRCRSSTSACMTGEYVCVMRRGHPLATGPFTLDEFCAARHLLVSFSGRPYGFIDEALARSGASGGWC